MASYCMAPALYLARWCFVVVGHAMPWALPSLAKSKAAQFLHDQGLYHLDKEEINASGISADEREGLN